MMYESESEQTERFVSEHLARTAEDMAEVFIEMAHFNPEDGQHYMCEDCFIVLHEMFGEVLEEHRAEVFTKFLSALDARGVAYNKQEFV